MTQQGSDQGSTWPPIIRPEEDAKIGDFGALRPNNSAGKLDFQAISQLSEKSGAESSRIAICAPILTGFLRWIYDS